jgi:regulator of cell morphogenesis and NO signaling
VLKGKVPKPASFGKVKKSVSSMLDDHEASAHQLDEIRELTNNYVCSTPDAEDIQEYFDELQMLDRNLRMHIFIENYVLFKKARAMEKKFMRRN